MADFVDIPTEGSGYPGKKAAAIGGTSLERVRFEAEKAASASTVKHELHPDPHPQYLEDTDLSFTLFYKHRAVLG